MNFKEVPDSTVFLRNHPVPCWNVTAACLCNCSLAHGPVLAARSSPSATCTLATALLLGLDCICSEQASLMPFEKDYVNSDVLEAHRLALDAYGCCTWREAGAMATVSNSA